MRDRERCSCLLPLGGDSSQSQKALARALDARGAKPFSVFGALWRVPARRDGRNLKGGGQGKAFP